MSRQSSALSDKRRYYDVLFPAMLEGGYMRLITCDGRFPLERCELAPRWLIDGQDIMQRNLTFSSEQDVLALCKKMPDTLQLGGVLPHEDPRVAREMMRNGVASAEGVLMLDIDANDYPGRGRICPCGTRPTICQICWDTLIEGARLVIDYLLRKVFLLRCVFDVFSGRRGMHTWCYDPRVLQWTREQRTAFMARIRAPAILATAAMDDHAEVIERILRTHVGQHAVGLDRAELFERFYPRFDEEVTKDAGHLKGLPLSMHHSTLYIRVPLPILDAAYKFELARHCIKPNNMDQQEIQAFLTGIINQAF